MVERAVAGDGDAPRWWRTREDPFADVWQSEVVPQLVADTAGRLQVLTLFKALCRRHPGRFQPGQLRTLQRRVREWRVQYGPDRGVYFEHGLFGSWQTWVKCLRKLDL